MSEATTAVLYAPGTNCHEETAAAIEQAGGRPALVLLRDLAFIVSVKNRTVVTAIDGEHLRDNVFTNIDSAVVAG